jgi:drug/metabolite transporter (DMT)-like permease
VSGEHGPANWSMLLALTVLWGSAFALTKVAVAGLPPGLVLSGRLLVACLLLLPLALLAARRTAGRATPWARRSCRASP